MGTPMSDAAARSHPGWHLSLPLSIIKTISMSDATYSPMLVSHHRYFIAHSLVSLIFFFVNKQWPTPNTLDTHFHAGPKEGYQCLTKVICTPTCAIVYLMVLYMKQWGRCQVGSVLLSAIVSLFSGVSLVQ